MDLYIFRLKERATGNTAEIIVGDTADTLQTAMQRLDEIQQGPELKYFMEATWPNVENKGALLTKEMDAKQEAATSLIEKAKQEGKCWKHLKNRWYQAMDNYSLAHSTTQNDQQLQKNAIHYGLEAVLTEYRRMQQ